MSDPSDVVPVARWRGRRPAPTALSSPQLSGEPRAGKTLVASTGSWSRASSYDYQWRRCDPSGASCDRVGGATASNYALDADDVGHTLRVVVTASHRGGSASVSSAPSGVVAAMPVAVPAPTSTALPEIDGDERAGRTLRASTGSWSNLPLGYAYQWRRCNAAGADCSAVGGATGSRYELTGDDVGRTLRVSVTAGNVGGSTTVTSAASEVVTSRPSSNTAPTPPASAPPCRHRHRRHRHRRHRRRRRRHPRRPQRRPRPRRASSPSRTAHSRTSPARSSSGRSFRRPSAPGRATRRSSPSSGSGVREDLETCSPILGATQVAYTVTPDDVDRYVIIEVTVSGAWGSTTITSKFGRPVKRSIQS